MTDTFETLRALLHQPAHQRPQFSELWQLIDAAWQDDPATYPKEWLGYMERFPEYFHRIPLQSLDYVEMILEVIPFARFILRPKSPVFGGPPITKAQLESPLLAHFTSLELCDQLLSPNTIAALADTPHASVLSCLHLINTGLTDDGLTRLAASKRLLGLRTIHLNSNHIEGPGLTALAQSPTFADLTTLCLKRNRVATHSTAPLQALASLPQLTSLDLSYNYIGDRGAEALAKAALPRLEHLDLAYNDIRDVGAAALATLTQPMKRLTSVILENNRIGPSGLSVLENAPFSGTWTTLRLGEQSA